MQKYRHVPQPSAVMEHSITATMERTGRNMLGVLK